MRKNNTPADADITPSKNKLKQARLPFKLLSDVSPKSESPQTRKRKLSNTDVESTPKIGKISEENNLIEKLIVINDEDSKDDVELQRDNKVEKLLNPYVKLVANARKKKQKSIKKQNKKSKIKNDSEVAQNESVSDSADNKKDYDVEMMDVDVPAENDDKTNNTDSKKDTVEQTTQSESTTVSPKQNCNSRQPVNSTEACNEGNIIVLEDSNDTSNMNITDPEVTEKENIEVDKSTESTENEVQITPTVITPKRSLRNKAKEEKNRLNSSVSDSTLDESLCSDTTSMIEPDDRDKSLNESTSINLTPKQLQKKQEIAKKKEEREKEKQEREKKRQQEKEEREKQKLEKEDQKKREREEKEEARRKEKEEKEEQKRKEKEEKEKQKELERKLKEEKEEQKRKEREEKEEQKRKEKDLKEEAKRKKQEALEQEKIEQELKKKKATEAFVNFFVPKQKADKDKNAVALVSKSSVLSSFTIKADMRLAPTTRTDLSEESKETLDRTLKEQDLSEKCLYLGNLKEGLRKPEVSGKTWPLTDKYDDDVIIVEDELPLMDGADEILTCDEPREKLRPKLLSFHENRRPPYWGTWRKKSSFVKPRRPFRQDEKQLDYEVDSDDEWEEEEGESIDGSAAGSDDEPDDEYEVDHEVFVPHGYLSDEEATMDGDDVLSLSPETQKVRLKHLEDEFEFEMKKPTEKLKPKLYGLLWETNDGGKPEKCLDALWNYFKKLSMVMNDPTPLLQPPTETEEVDKKKIKKKKIESEKAEQKTPKSEKKTKSKAEIKESKKSKTEKKNASEVKNQPGINSFLTKIKGA